MNPKLRALEIIPFSRRDRDYLLLRDRLGFTSDAALPRELGPLLALFDGTRAPAQIIADYAALGGETLPDQFIAKVVAELDEGLLLDSPRFAAHRQELVRQFARSAARPVAFAGQSYPDEPGELRACLDEFFRQATRLKIEEPQAPAGRLRGIVVPHIDFARGGPAEALAYTPLLHEKGPFDVFVVLGIAHCGVRYPFCAAAKDYETPLGTCRVDAAFVEALRARVGERLTTEQFAHKNEHSIEFVAVFLQHMASLREARIVPILCGGFHDETRRGASPALNPDVSTFIAALREVVDEWESRGRRVGFIASVDGAHVGSRFGDDTPLTSQRLRQIEQADREFFACAQRGDAEALHRAMARDSNARNVDAHPALYTLLAAFPDLKGRLLHYAQAFDEAANSVVSFAAMTLYDTAAEPADSSG